MFPQIKYSHIAAKVLSTRSRIKDNMHFLQTDYYRNTQRHFLTHIYTKTKYKYVVEGERKSGEAKEVNVQTAFVRDLHEI